VVCFVSGFAVWTINQRPKPTKRKPKKTKRYNGEFRAPEYFRKVKHNNNTIVAPNAKAKAPKMPMLLLSDIVIYLF